MNLINKASFSLAASIFISACSSTPPPAKEYNDNHSRAWNIVTAADMVTGIDDAKLPKNTSSSGIYDTAFVLSGFYSGLNGLDGFTGGFYNLGWSLITPKAHGKRNTLIGWLPLDKAKNEEEARQVFLDEVTQAIKLSLDELGVEYEVAYKDSSTTYLTVSDHKEWGCDAIDGKEDYCQFNAKVYDPTIVNTPSFVNSPSEKSWAFKGNSGVYFNYITVGDNIMADSPNTVDQVKLNGLISKNLPSYAYIYIAPNKVKDSKGNKVKIPYLLEKGEPKLFIYPEQ